MEIKAIAPIGKTLPIIAAMVPTNKASKCHALGATPSGTGITNQINNVMPTAMATGISLKGISASFVITQKQYSPKTSKNLS